MGVEQIMKLLDAGFTKDEIMQMMPKAEEPKAEEPKVEEPKVKEPEVKAEQIEEKTTVSNEDVLKAIAKLTSTIQANAIQSSVQPVQHTQEDAESMIAEIIRPSFKERGVT